MEGSRALQLKALPLIEQLFCEVNPIPVKKAANLMGMEVGGVTYAFDRDDGNECSESGKGDG